MADAEEFYSAKLHKRGFAAKPYAVAAALTAVVSDQGLQVPAHSTAVFVQAVRRPVKGTVGGVEV